MRFYLDACCLNRPFDDQTQQRIRLETEAVLLVLASVHSETNSLIHSQALELEIDKNPDADRKEKLAHLLKLATSYVRLSPGVVERARILHALGFAGFDSLHLACAEADKADMLFTTDDRLLRRARRFAADLRVQAQNPLEWFAEMNP